MPNAEVDARPKSEERARTILWLPSEEGPLTPGALVPVSGRAGGT